MPDAHGIRPAYRGIFSTGSRAEGTVSPVRRSAQPAWTLPLTQNKRTDTHTNTHTQNKHYTFRRWYSSFLRHKVLFIYIVCEPDSQPRRTNCVLARGGRTCLAGETLKHTRKDSRSVAPLLLFPVSFFSSSCDLFPAAKTRNPGLNPYSEDERKLDLRSRLWGCFTGFISLWRKSDPGAERCAKKPRSSSSLLSVLSISPSINLSTHPLLSICLSICFHVLGPCDFAKMHHQQRMAALGTDKELSDLLDFSAVRKSTFFSYR